MFEVLVFVYENYCRGDACPELPQLECKVSAVGFQADEIHKALNWLDVLNLAAQGTRAVPPEGTRDLPIQSATSMRVFSVAEQDRLGA